MSVFTSAESSSPIYNEVKCFLKNLNVPIENLKKLEDVQFRIGSKTIEMHFILYLE